MQAILNHYIWRDNSGKETSRVSLPHRTLAKAARAAGIVERATGGACRHVLFEGVEVEPHLVG